MGRKEIRSCGSRVFNGLERTQGEIEMMWCEFVMTRHLLRLEHRGAFVFVGVKKSCLTMMLQTGPPLADAGSATNLSGGE